MQTPLCHQPSHTWYIKFKHPDAPSSYTGLNGIHYMEEKLRNVFGEINTRKGKVAKIDTEKIVLT